jgi:hypothetical protein
MDEQNKQSAVDAANSGSDEAELTDADLIEQFNQLSPRFPRLPATSA